jgi:hypothetical protein
MSGESTDEKPFEHEVHSLARKVLVAFVFTFIAARVSVILIMSRAIPDLYIHVGGTHIHHLNHGIFLLVGVGAYLLFRRPQARGLSAAAIFYGIGLALTFDEFGMWLRLSDVYWQRASFDAIMVVGGVLGVIAFAPELKPRLHGQGFRPRHWATAVALGVAVIVFGIMLAYSFKYAGRAIGPRLERFEASSPR